jgi:hypothetical protein
MVHMWRQTHMRSVVFTALAILVLNGGIVAAAEVPPPTADQPVASGDNQQVQERAIRPVTPSGVRPGGIPTQPIFERTLPPDLCRDDGAGGARCHCDNFADCQRLTQICGGGCPAGSHHCNCRAKTVN